jgi:hypothetical protein
MVSAGDYCLVTKNILSFDEKHTGKASHFYRNFTQSPIEMRCFLSIKKIFY